MPEAKGCWKCGGTGVVRHPGSVHACTCETGQRIERELAVTSSRTRETVDTPPPPAEEHDEETSSRRRHR